MAKTVQFTKEQLELLVSNYRQELEDVLNYAEQIREILKKLDPSTTPAKQEKKPATKRGRKKQVPAEKTAPKKRGRKPKVETPVAAIPVVEEKKEPLKNAAKTAKAKTNKTGAKQKTKKVKETKSVVKKAPKTPKPAEQNAEVPVTK